MSNQAVQRWPEKEHQVIDLETICELGLEYQLTGSRNVSLLAEAVELFRAQGTPTVAELVAIVEEIPGCAESWRLWSEDKRWLPAWAFDHSGGKYWVGYWSGIDGDPEPESFDNINEACAEYIIREIEDYARILAYRGGE